MDQNKEPSFPKLTSLKEKLDSLHPDRRKKIEDASERMYVEYCDSEAVLDKLVEDSQNNDMGY